MPRTRTRSDGRVSATQLHNLMRPSRGKKEGECCPKTTPPRVSRAEPGNAAAAAAGDPDDKAPKERACRIIGVRPAPAIGELHALDAATAAAIPRLPSPEVERR
mmetsp:Transcript_3742/g.10428  ORF Transcript_3742/g.10428 Transcript_3742/m.10428 type:complete len:104 (+) Transcript_3742:255-566(+)